MSEKQFDITIDAGANFFLAFTIKDSEGSPVDLTGAEVKAQLREYTEGSDSFDFTATNNGEGGKIALTMSPEVTAQIGFTKGVYDVFTIKNGETNKWLYGKATINSSVTR